MPAAEFPLPSLAPVLTGSLLGGTGICHAGLGYATGSVVYDFYGGVYTVTQVDSLGHVLAVTETAAPTITGWPPPTNPIPMQNSPAATGNGLLSLNLQWAQTTIVIPYGGPGGVPFLRSS